MVSSLRLFGFALLPAGIHAVAIFLGHAHVGTAPAGDGYCHFDHIELGADSLFAAGFEGCMAMRRPGTWSRFP